MYSGYLLSTKSRNQLKALYPPKYPDFIGEHVTEKFPDTALPEAPQTVRIIGYADDGKMCEGFLVEVDGTTKRPSGGLYHLTWSIDRNAGAKPVHTNDIINGATRIDPITIQVSPKLFD